MKKFLAVILAALMLLAIVGCKKTEDVDSDGADGVAAPIDAVVVNSADGWDTYGITSYVCDKTGTYTFTAGGMPETITWKVFVLDGEFEDALRYLNQAYEADLEGDGSLEVTEGQYIYVMCSESAMNGGDVVDTATCTFVCAD